MSVKGMEKSPENNLVKSKAPLHSGRLNGSRRKTRIRLLLIKLLILAICISGLFLTLVFVRSLRFLVNGE